MSTSGKDEYARRNDQYYEARNTGKELANIALRLGKVEDFFRMSFQRPRSMFAEPFDYAIINSKNEALPALTELLKSPDISIRTASSEMINKIMHGETYNMSSYFYFEDRI
jgi:hypothetical protein